MNQNTVILLLDYHELKSSKLERPFKALNSFPIFIMGKRLKQTQLPSISTETRLFTYHTPPVDNHNFRKPN